MLESDVYRKFHEALGEFFDVHRIENAIGAGAFDCALSWRNKTIWVELKKNVEQPLRGSQIAWVVRRVRAKCELDMYVVSMDDGNFVVADGVEMAVKGYTMIECRAFVMNGGGLVTFMTMVFDALPGEKYESRLDAGTAELH